MFAFDGLICGRYRDAMTKGLRVIKSPLSLRTQASSAFPTGTKPGKLLFSVARTRLAKSGTSVATIMHKHGGGAGEYIVRAEPAATLRQAMPGITYIFTYGSPGNISIVDGASSHDSNAYACPQRTAFPLARIITGRRNHHSSPAYPLRAICIAYHRKDKQAKVPILLRRK